jgi:hypothetical protein
VISIDPAVLLNYRLAVARIGERDLFHWWDSNALSEEGQFALRRLFRQSSMWVGIDLALEAARLRHESLVPPRAGVTLFNLGPEIEGSFSSWIIRTKAEVQVEVVKIPIVPDTARASVAQAFYAMNVPIGEAKPGNLRDRAIDVGQIARDDLQADTLRIVHILLAAYVNSGKTKFIAPYATLKLDRT